VRRLEDDDVTAKLAGQKAIAEYGHLREVLAADSRGDLSICR
jgi:hypothetical protein